MRKFTMLLGLLISSFAAVGADMSNGADNFYKSDKVTQQKVTFKNQYQMNVVGKSVYTEKGWIRMRKTRRLSLAIPMGAVKRTKLKSVCPETGRTRVCDTGN
ncbi:Uncharacterised protein [Serratia fonticola]|uniref:Uncharacterized protein n=1 Tax=Serratia fonticola TaxID=47917 RepID=A0A4U9UAA7_SERFO|nr:Uncharacterised protein [Serratia fonticola]